MRKDKYLGDCVTRNNLDFDSQLKSYQTLSPAYSC